MMDAYQKRVVEILEAAAARFAESDPKIAERARAQANYVRAQNGNGGIGAAIRDAQKLVDRCACGAVALYVVGLTGYCKKHRADAVARRVAATPEIERGALKRSRYRWARRSNLGEK